MIGEKNSDSSSYIAPIAYTLDSDMPKGDEAVLIYPNRFARGQGWDMLESLKNQGYACSEEFIVDSQTVMFENLSREKVYDRMLEIVSSHKGKKIKAVMSGYSPMVALMLEAARRLDIECVVYARNGGDTFSELVI